MRSLRPLLLLALTALGFFPVSAAMRAIVPWPDDQGLWSKWQHFLLHKDEYDAVWIGSSTVLRDVDNVAIDRQLGERGIELCSFNFGVGGMGTYEQDFLLHKLLALEPARLRYVFLEGGPIGEGIHPRHIFQTPGDTFTVRSVFWHDAAQTGKVLRQVSLLPFSLEHKIDLATVHLRLLARKLASYGLGPETPRTFEGFDEERARPWLIDHRGHRPYAETHSAEFEALRDDPTRYDEHAAVVIAQNATPLRLEEINTDVHRAQFAATAARGVELIYVCLPVSMGEPERPFLHEQGVIPALLDFNRPELHPELFRFQYRWDEDHLNPEGVARLTPLLADGLAPLLRSEGGE